MAQTKPLCYGDTPSNYVYYEANDYNWIVFYSFQVIKFDSYTGSIITAETRTWKFNQLIKSTCHGEHLRPSGWEKFSSSLTITQQQQGGSTSLVVMGRDSRSKDCGFESRHHILDVHFFTYNYCTNCNDVCSKRPKINEKEDRIGPFLSNNKLWRMFDAFLSNNKLWRMFEGS